MRGIRFRATAIVTLVFAAALLVGGLLLVTVLRDRLTENLDRTLGATAADRARLLDEGAAPDTLTDTQLRESLIWVGTAGETVAAGGPIELTEPPADLMPADIGTVRTETVEFREVYLDGEVSTEREPLRLAIDASTEASAEPVYVVVGSELEVVSGPVGDVVTLLIVGSPFLLAVVGGLTWFTADRALRPVERIRRSAENVTSHGDGSTIDVPPTGDEIEHLAETINKMMARLAAADDRQRSFIGDASHELKSPLANLRIAIETGQADDEATRSYLVQIDRLTALVDDLLALAAHDEAQSPRRDPVDLDDVVFDALAASAPERRCQIDIDGITPTRVTGDAQQLRRLVRNLIDNALRHASSEVAVSLSADETEAVLLIDDDGRGVPPEDRDAIFERFTRSDAARSRDAGGTGLGLAIVRETTERHDGTVSVTDSPLGGARFVVTLPCNGPSQAAAEQLRANRHRPTD